MPTARVAGIDLHYDVRGRGPALLLLHAFPLSLAVWDEQARALADVCQVVRFDARGFGGTPPGDGLLTMERIADDAAALLRHLALPSAIVGGISMGGYAAFAFVRRHPTLLRGLVLTDTRAGADTPEARENRSRQAEDVRRRGPEAVADAFLPKLVGETTRKQNPALVARLREIILGTPAQGIVDALHGLAARADSTPTLREVQVPTLVVCGTEDVLTPPAESEALHAAIAGSRLELVPGAGHLAPLEQPSPVSVAMRSFVTSLGRA